MIALLLLAPAALYVGNQACAGCHSEIFKAYSQTPMARSSGVVAGGLLPGSFVHADSETTYRINAAGVVTVVTPTQTVERRLGYFIGSGAAGRSFLYTRDGFLFQAPVTWYAQQGRWDASPGYEQDRVSRWNRPIASDCLNCHSSQVRAAAGFTNRYAEPPFAQPGIGCERCHGPGSEHIAGHAKMLDPAKLDPARRDSVCAQCHMSGEAREARLGMRFADYRPGALLADYAAYFVYEGAPPLKATSYVEKLAASRCKAVSGDRLWCGTCHDPHRTPAAGERVAWYRERCLGCHQPAQCRRGTNCVACHMPRGPVVGGGHGVLTDHSIPRRASSPESLPPRDVWKLQPFSKADAGARELGLAYAEISAPHRRCPPATRSHPPVIHRRSRSHRRSSAQGTDARRHSVNELACSSGGAIDTGSVVRELLGRHRRRPAPRRPLSTLRRFTTSSPALPLRFEKTTRIASGSGQSRKRLRRRQPDGRSDQAVAGSFAPAALPNRGSPESAYGLSINQANRSATCTTTQPGGLHD